MAVARSKALACLVPHIATLATGLFFIYRLQLPAGFDLFVWPAWFSGWALAIQLLDRSVRTTAGFGQPRWLVAILATVLLVCTWLSSSLHFWQWLFLVGAAGLGRLVRRMWLWAARLNASVWMEGTRWLLLLIVSLGLLHPFATVSLVGGGDAQVYVQALADFVAQLHAGVFPVLVGQSDYAFNGEIHPLRTAPGFFYLGGVLDLLTAGTLSACALQNLLIVFSGVAAAFTSYLSLVHLAPRHGWTACLLAVLFITSPGVLAPIYSGDMVATWMTLPWLPLLFLGLLRMVDSPHAWRWPLLAAVMLASLWSFHAPIGFWSSVCAMPFALCHAAKRWNGPRSLVVLFGLLGVAVLLTAYVFVSVATLEMPPDSNIRTAVQAGAIEASLASTWQGFFQPVSRGADALLTDLQLSPGLWLALGIGMLGLGRFTRLASWLLAAVFAALVILLLPPLGRPVWGMMPDAVLISTDKWPAQRFFMILSAGVPFLCLPMLAVRWQTQRLLARDITLLLLVGGGWSLAESVKFIRRGWSISLPPALTQQRFLPENTKLSRYSFEYYTHLPRYFSFGPMEPLGETRLLQRDSLEPLDSGADFLLRSPNRPGVLECQYEATDYGGRFSPSIELAPKARYLLHFDFRGGQPQGALQIAGKDVQAEYFLPNSGEERAFGASPGNAPTLSIWHRTNRKDQVEIKFIRTPGAPAALPAPRLRVIPLVETDPLPVTLQGLIPFKVRVRASADGWLETPKLFVPGYTPTVNGQPVTAAMSPDGLVMVPVPAGQSEVIIRYTGQWMLHVAFWLSAASWLLVILGAIQPHWLELRMVPIETILRWLGGVTAIAVLLAALAFLSSRSGTNSLPVAPISTGITKINVRFSIDGIAGQSKTLAQVTRGLSTESIVVEHVDGKHARVGFTSDGRKFTFGAPFPVNYRATQLVEIKVPPSLDAAPVVRVNHRLVFEIVHAR